MANEVMLLPTMEDMKKAISDKIGAAFLDMIPHVVWDKMVEDQWKLYVHGQSASEAYYQHPDGRKAKDYWSLPSEGRDQWQQVPAKPAIEAQLPKLIQVKIQEWAQKIVKERMEVWEKSQNSKDADKYIEMVLREVAQKCAETFMAQTANGILASALASMSSIAPGYCQNGHMGKKGSSCSSCGNHINY